MQNSSQFDMTEMAFDRYSQRSLDQKRREEKCADLSLDKIEKYLNYLESTGRVSGTLDWYRRALNRFYHFLPENDKYIRNETLKNWQQQLIKENYASSTINEFIVVVNGYLEYAKLRQFQVIERLHQSDEIQPELSRSEYLRLLQTAKLLNRERAYLLVKLFGNTDMPVQELPKLTAEAVVDGYFTVSNKGIKQVIRLPDCLKNELASYIDRQGIITGPVFLTRKGEPMSRSNVNTGISQLSEAARVPIERATPRALRRMYRSMQENMEHNIRLIVEQAQARMLEQEQLTIGWEE